MTKQVTSYAAMDSKSALAPFKLQRRDPLPHDVQIEILFCGVCHSDLHVVRNEWKGTTYPVVPGHEIVGRVVKIGNAVKGFKEGEVVAVGCMVGSCQKCPNCKEGLEQYCDLDLTATYNSPDRYSDGITYGGYSKEIVVNEKFVLRVPKAFKDSDLAGVAPLLCAGITTYSPLHHWKVGKGSKVGVVGLGGLGHMGIKIAHALGAHVVLFTTSPGKIPDAKRFGANEVILSKNVDDLKLHANSFDFILNTVAVPHNLDTYVDLLKRDGTLCMVGLPEHLHPSINTSALIFRRKQIAGSLIGGIKETQEMLDFCAKHQIVSDIEMIPIQKINEAYERMLKSDVKYRFVIDLASL
jgi:uncharacterized zinc-type alcohol dehydrogenase-like protein